MLLMVPAELSIVPALKYVVYPSKIVPFETEFTFNSEGVNPIRNSNDFIDCVGMQRISSVNVLPAATVLLIGFGRTVGFAAE